jgi:hypothetical protein
VTTIQQLRTLRDGTALPDLFGFIGTRPANTGETGWEQVEPVPDLVVTARREENEYRTRTSDDGSYAFRGLPTGRYRVSVQAPPGRLVLWGNRADHLGVNVGLGDACPANFEVFYDGRISGTVVSSDGQAVSGWVFAWYEGPEKEKVKAAPQGGQINNGHFEIPRLWPGRYRLVFQSSVPQMRPTYYPGTLNASEAVLVELSDGTHVDGLRFAVY